jgi:hypothetical protein
MEEAEAETVLLVLEAGRRKTASGSGSPRGIRRSEGG